MKLGAVLETSSSTVTNPERGRPLRADAQRNIGALLEAARTVFVRSGVDAPAKEITDLAGVGIGTLYRHFPRRSDLIVAVLQHEVDQCIDAADELANTLRPWEALTSWIERFTHLVGTKTGLAAALHSGDPAYDNLAQQLLDRLEPAAATLLARAVEGNAARDDVTAREMLVSIALLSQLVPGREPTFNQRMIQVFIDGLARTAKRETAPRRRRVPDAERSANGA